MDGNPISKFYPLQPSMLAKCVAMIKAIPRMSDGKRIHWSADVLGTAFIATAILRTDDHKKSASDIAEKSGASLNVLNNLARGHRADGNVWPELRAVLKIDGVMWNESPTAKARREASEKGPTAADAIAPATFEELPRPQAPASGAVSKSTTLAVTNKGEVVSAPLPVAATTPTAIVAPGGDFAVKTNTTRCVLDTKTNDILVINTTRITFGTPEWCAKMVELNKKP